MKRANDIVEPFDQPFAPHLDRVEAQSQTLRFLAQARRVVGMIPRKMQ